MNLAPIILFVYDRPEHTLKTLTGLKNNLLAKDSTLYVFADGPKVGAPEKQIEAIGQVREIIHSQAWCGEIIYQEADTNKGLYQSIRNGVSQVVAQYGKVIVLEDDLELSPCFLSYMNQALDFYQARKSVFSISGFNYPSKVLRLPDDYSYDTYVSLRNASWGWATWMDRWQQIDWEVKAYKELCRRPEMKSALNRMGDDEFEMLAMQQSGRLNIWSIQFTMAHFVNHAVAIYPTRSYVNNIGLDGSGENCGTTQAYANESLSTNENPKFVEILYEDKRIINAFYNVACRKRRPLLQRIINRLCRMSGMKPLFTIKQKIYK